MKNNQYMSILSLAFWMAYWKTMRPYLIFVSGAAGIVGLAFIVETSILRIGLAFIPLLFSYGLGQALTDCFQMDTDAISSPYRPLIQGIISPKQVLIVSLVGLTISVVILGILNPGILILGIFAVFGLLTYTTLKRTWWGGPPWNSWIVALLPIMGRLVDKEYQFAEIIDFKDTYSLTFFFAILAIFFGYANFVVMGYFKDISADRKTGYQTFPVVFGWLPAAIYSDVTALLAASFTGLVLCLLGGVNIFGIIIFIIAIGINFYAQFKIHKTREENATHGPIACVVRAFILYCLAIIVTLKSGWLIPLILFYSLFEIILKLRPEKTQV